MRLMELLARLSNEQEQAFGSHRIWSPEVQEGCTWREAVLDRQMVKRAASRLSPVAESVLRELMQAFQAAPAEEEKLLHSVRHHAGLSGAEARSGLRELEQAGVVFAVRKQWGEYMYFMPTEMFLCWQFALWEAEACDNVLQHEEKLLKGLLHPYKRSLGKQLLSAFAALGKSDMTLTKKGVLTKKTIDKLHQAMELDEALFGPLSLQWAHREHYSFKTAFVLEAAFALGLVEQHTSALVWNETNLTHWLAMHEQDREQELLNWFLDLLLSCAGPDALAIAWTVHQSDSRWHTSRDFVSDLRQQKVVDQAATATYDHMYWLELFHCFGWMNVMDYVDAQGTERLFKWLLPVVPEAGSKADTDSPPYLTLQLNGEVFAENSCPFTIKWELELMADRLSDEYITIYQLTKDSIAQALEMGRTRATIKLFLRTVSGENELPEALEALLDAWTAKACRTQFREVVLLRCDSVEMAAIIDQNPLLAPLILDKLGSTDYIVSKSSISELRRLLKLAGYPPRRLVACEEEQEYQYPLIQGEPTSPKSGRLFATECPISRPIFIYCPNTLQHFRLEGPANRNDELTMPDAALVSPLWTKQLRVYHHSTRREMLEQALNWQTTVELRMEHGLHAFVPEKLEQNGQEWAVVGLLRQQEGIRSIRLTPDMWDEMRLIVPSHGEHA